MAKMKKRTAFVCDDCGSDQPRWSGKCPVCGEWNTMKEFTISTGSKRRETTGSSVSVVDLSGDETGHRYISRISEWDRVVGGGILSGSVTLLAGEPGIGKSTLAFQVVHAISKKESKSAAYFSNEESPDQIRMRAKRLKCVDAEIRISGESCIESISEIVERENPSVMVIDSIQTVWSDSVDSLPGSISQIRESTARLIRLAKSRSMPVILIGHITKEGIIAGPRLLEHMVDTVLYLEGESQQFFRILRSVKNRFGNTNEIGVFEMGYTGLIPVSNPSGLFISSHRENVSGSALVVSLEGTRPLLIEVQALVARATYGTPQRSVTGINIRRLAMLLAVLERRLGHFMGAQDVFVNLVGGLKIDEPGIDLGIIAAVASAFTDEPIDETMVLMGEIGLAGEIRPVPRVDTRINEINRMGYTAVILPKGNLSRLTPPKGVKIHGVATVKEAFDILFSK